MTWFRLYPRPHWNCSAQDSRKALTEATLYQHSILNHQLPAKELGLLDFICTNSSSIATNAAGFPQLKVSSHTKYPKLRPNLKV